MQKKFNYPYDAKWILISLVLIISCFVFAILFLGEHVFLYLFYTAIVSLLFLWIKYSLYSKLDKFMDNPLLPPLDLDDEQHSIWIVILLIALIFSGLVVPFLMLAFIDPITWFALFVGFIAGMNMPEIILFFYSRMQK